jgi:hypothetical protein
MVRSGPLAVGEFHPQPSPTPSDVVLFSDELRRARGFSVHRQDRLIASCNSWSDFWERTKELPAAAEKGAALERLTQLYLQTAPEYLTELQHVWLLRDVPPAVRRQLDLPLLDEGIDLIACTRRGEYWANSVEVSQRKRSAPHQT